MIWRAFIVLSLLLVAGVSLLVGRRDAGDAPEEGRREPPQPGYYMVDAVITEMNPDGSQRYRVAAEHIAQDPATQAIDLENMKLVYRVDPEREWTLTARNGHVPPASKVLDLAGDVEIKGLPNAGAGTVPAVVRTERLQLDTETNVATTSARVDIIWGNRRISTMGLKADLKAEKLQLESSVHGRFVR